MLQAALLDCVCFLILFLSLRMAPFAPGLTRLMLQRELDYVIAAIAGDAVPDGFRTWALVRQSIKTILKIQIISR